MTVPIKHKNHESVKGVDNEDLGINGLSVRIFVGRKYMRQESIRS